MKKSIKTLAALCALTVFGMQGCALLAPPDINKYEVRSVLWKKTHHAEEGWRERGFSSDQRQAEKAAHEFFESFFETAFRPLYGTVNMKESRYPLDWSVWGAHVLNEKANFLSFRDNDFEKNRAKFYRVLAMFFPDYKNNITVLENDDFRAEIINFPKDKCAAALALTSRKGSPAVQTVDFLYQNDATGKCKDLRDSAFNYVQLRARMQRYSIGRYLIPSCSTVDKSHFKAVKTSEENFGFGTGIDRPPDPYSYVRNFHHGWCINEKNVLIHYFWPSNSYNDDDPPPVNAPVTDLKRDIDDSSVDFIVEQQPKDEGHSYACGRDSLDGPIYCKEIRTE
jgi:hypothetical protein